MITARGRDMANPSRWIPDPRAEDPFSAWVPSRCGCVRRRPGIARRKGLLGRRLLAFDSPEDLDRGWVLTESS